MYTQAEFKNMLFIDIETATQFKDYKDFKKNGSSHMVELWSRKADSIRLYESHKANLSDQEMYEDCAAIHSEFSKIIVITIGQVKFDEIGLPYTSNIRSSISLPRKYLEGEQNEQVTCSSLLGI